MLSRMRCKLRRSVEAMTSSSSRNVSSKTDTICATSVSISPWRSAYPAYVVVTLEVLQGRMSSQDDEDGRLEPAA